MKKNKIALSIFALLLGLVFILICIEHFRGEFALDARLKQLRAQGEKLNYKELVPPKIPPEQNAAIVLTALTNELQPFFELSKQAPLTMTFAKPGIAIASWQRDSWEVDKKTSNTWSKFGPEIATANPHLAKLESIWTKNGFDDGYDYAKGFTDTNFNSMLVVCRQTSLLLDEAAENDLRTGDLESARRHLHSILAMTRCFGTEPLVIDQLVDAACARSASRETWSALQAKGWTEDQLADLQSAWESINDFPSAMAKSCELEQAMTLDFFRQIRASKSKELDQLHLFESVGDLLPDYNPGPPTHGFVLNYIHLPLWRVAWAAQDELRAIHKWMPLVEAGKIATNKSWADIKSRFSADELEPSFLGLGIAPSSKLGFYNRCRFLFSSEPFSLNGTTLLRRPLEVETEKNMIITVIALKRYELRHGKPAAQLTDLVPEFIASVPLDRMDGKPLRYRLNADGGFTLYSVGLNCTDDGGNPGPEKPLKDFHNIWEGWDAVWPTAALD